MLRESLPGLRAVYRFGSSGSVYETPQSDLDLAVWCLPAVPDDALWWLAQDLAAQCGRDVDLVNLNTASTVMRHQIVTTGERLFAAPPLIDIELFETHVLSEYASLNERRALILQDVLESGAVYGR
jgi:predicted nucleotidyltransferase